MAEKFFNEKELLLLGEIISQSEEMVADFYKMSDSDWKKFRYEFLTLKDLKEDEIVKGPFAQIVKYNAKPWGSDLASSFYTIYRICILDKEIKERVKNFKLPLESFFYYIIVHELIHVVRFSKYIQKFEAKGDEIMVEEKKVHDLTKKIVERSKIGDKEKVFEFFKNRLPF